MFLLSLKIKSTSRIISITSTNGTNAVITCALVGAAVTAITIKNGGSNYATTPTIVFTPVNGGSGASATPTLVLGTKATFITTTSTSFTTATSLAATKTSIATAATTKHSL